MTVRIYRSDDVSAPAGITSAAGSLIAVLDACLVNGYGAKAGAGWTKSFSGTNKAAYRQGAGSNQFYLRVDDTPTVYARIRGYEAMTDVDTGTGLVPTDAQVSGGLYAMKANSATARPWIVIADETFFFFWTGYDEGAYTNVASGITYYKPCWMFGDFESNVTADAYNTIIAANTTTSSTDTAVGSINGGEFFSTATTGHYVFRALSQTGGSITCGKYTPLRTNGTYALGATGPAYPAPQDNGYLLLPIYITETLATGNVNGVIRGSLKCLRNPYHNSPGNHGDTLSGKGADASRSFMVLLISSAGSTAKGAVEYSDTW